MHSHPHNLESSPRRLLGVQYYLDDMFVKVGVVWDRCRKNPPRNPELNLLFGFLQDADAVQAGLQTVVSYWHDVALKTHLRDYSKAALGFEDDSPTQPGPAYTARAITIAHLALYDGLVGITGEGGTYMTYNRDSLSDFSGAFVSFLAVLLQSCSAQGTHKRPCICVESHDLETCNIFELEACCQSSASGHCIGSHTCGILQHLA